MSFLPILHLIDKQKIDIQFVIFVIMVVAIVKLAIDAIVISYYYAKKDEVLNAFLDGKEIECSALKSDLKVIKKGVKNGPYKLIIVREDRYVSNSVEMIEISNCAIK